MMKEAVAGAPAEAFELRTYFCAGADDALQRIICQWQFGDWLNLARLDVGAFATGSDRAMAAALRAAGHSQMGDYAAARECVRLALELGCDKHVLLKILVSGVHNTLGRISALMQQDHRAQSHFEQAIALGPFPCDPALVARGRTQEQCSQLGVTVPFTLSNPSHDSEHVAASTVKVEQTAAFNLGEAWSANTINTVIFRHHGVMTWNDIQYTAFYVDETTLRLVRRDLRGDALTTFDLKGEYDLRDAHNSISLGVDRSGHIHISYDHHASRLRYRRSKLPDSILEWTDELPMTGANEEKVTYPTFILPRRDYPLTLLYRDGIHNRGAARMKWYDESSQRWEDRPTPILSGADQKPWTSNAYWNHPAIGTDGSLHLSFVWRTDTLGERKLVNNVNIGYAWSPDNGCNWFTSTGIPYKLPITQVSAETVCAIAPGSNLINQCGMALDSHNRPHLAFYANDLHGVPQYQHLWFDGTSWHREYFSSRTSGFVLSGGGTLQLPISRPEILIDHKGDVYALFRGDFTRDRMSVTQLTAGSRGSTRHCLTKAELWPCDLEFAEPVIDRTRWQKDNVLTMLLQRNAQPNGDIYHAAKKDPVWLVDFCLA